MARRYRYYQNYSNGGCGTLLIMLYIITLVVKFVMRYKKIVFPLLILVSTIFLIFKYKNKIISFFKSIKKDIVTNKLKKKSNLYPNIICLNNKYYFEDLDYFYDSYQVRFKSNIKTCNIDDYLLMTINNKYNSLKKYKLEYDRLNSMYNQYLKEYSSLAQFINEEEARNLKINIKKYKKYQNLIFEENKIKRDYTFKVIIYINYRSKKGLVREKRYKVYDKIQFSKIMKQYLEMKKNGKLIEISYRIERSKMSESLRYDVFKRDNYRCCICGMSSKDGVKLQVDHIIPVSKGGKTEMSNLQTLCSRCNIGKSNKL